MKNSGIKKYGFRQSGFALNAELVLLSTVLVLGNVIGLGAVRNAISAELLDLAAVIEYRATAYYAFNGYPSATASTGPKQDFIDPGVEGVAVP
jgi:hypothetical protein